MQPEKRTELVAVYVAGGAVLAVLLFATALVLGGKLPVESWLAMAERVMVIVPALAGGYATLRTVKKGVDARAEAGVQKAHAAAEPRAPSPR